jgi:hypothetical protein
VAGDDGPRAVLLIGATRLPSSSPETFLRWHRIRIQLGMEFAKARPSTGSQEHRTTDSRDCARERYLGRRTDRERVETQAWHRRFRRARRRKSLDPPAPEAQQSTNKKRGKKERPVHPCRSTRPIYIQSGIGPGRRSGYEVSPGPPRAAIRDLRVELSQKWGASGRLSMGKPPSRTPTRQALTATMEAL